MRLDFLLLKVVIVNFFFLIVIEKRVSIVQGIVWQRSDYCIF